MQLRVVLFHISVIVYSCFAAESNENGGDEKIEISVESPAEELKKIPGLIFVEKGENVVMECKASLAVQWRKQGDDKGLWCKSHKCKEETRLTIANADADDSGIYDCFFTGKHDVDFKSIEIYVADSSAVTVEPAGEIIELNESMALNFSCKSNKEGDLATPLWSVNGKDLADVDTRFETFKNGSLYLKKPYGKNAGVYVCGIPGDGGSFTYNFVKVKGPGYVYQKHESSQNLMQGDTVTLKCEVYGFPTPTIQWLKNGKSDEIESHKRATYETYGGVEKGILKMSELEFEDRANYTCNATNSVGSGWAHTFVRVKDKLAALWPFLGIVAEVVLLVAIIFLYEKRRAKKEASEGEENADQKKALTEGTSDARLRTTVKA